MRKVLAITTIIYVIIIIFCVTHFFIQKSIVYGDHIRPVRARQSQFHQVQIRDRSPRAIREAEIRFMDDRMGNEIEEHLP